RQGPWWRGEGHRRRRPPQAQGVTVMRLQLRRLARHWTRNRVVTGVFLLLLVLASSVSVMFAEH
ncbi:MAG TPA: hypothetical protein D7I09_03255, partial [Candidatus Poseidoniales archaeon]